MMMGYELERLVGSIGGYAFFSRLVFQQQDNSACNTKKTQNNGQDVKNTKPANQSSTGENVQFTGMSKHKCQEQDNS